MSKFPQRAPQQAAEIAALGDGQLADLVKSMRELAPAAARTLALATRESKRRRRRAQRKALT